MNSLKLRKIWFIALTTLLIGLGIILLQPKLQAITNLPQLQFTISGCETEQMHSNLPEPEKQGKTRSLVKEIQVSVQEETVQFSHTLTYVCCADLQLKSDLNDHTLTITEVNTGDYCRCICDYNIDASFGRLPSGNYQLQVYGIEFKRPPLYSQDPILLFERPFTIP